MGTSYVCPPYPICMTFLSKLRWYYYTRGFGALAAAYELLDDLGSTDRATIFLAACGLMGVDTVARKSGGDKGHDDDTSH